MRTLIKTLLAVGSVLLAVGCAKERPVEKRKDPEGEMLAKAPFLTTNGAERRIWNSKVTVVKTSSNGGFAFVGFQSENRLGYFEFTKERLKFYDAISLYKPSQNSLPELINEWTVRHTDTKLAESDGNVTTTEVEDDLKRWKEKRFFSVDFSKASISENATFPGVYWSALEGCWNPAGSHLVDDSLKIESDNITFTVAVEYEQSSACASRRRGIQGDFTYTVHYKYSFWERKKSDYKPSVYKGEEDPEMKRFGFFQTVVERMSKDTKLPETRILKNRWNPKRKFVDYYFTKGFPEEYKWIFNDPKKGAIARTNQLFQRSGIDLRFRIWDNEDGPEGQKGKVKEFGDGRYSFINFVSEIDPEAPLGFGPSDVDPVSGEIIAANTIIWTGYLNYHLKVLDTKAEKRPTLTEKSTLFGHMKSLLGDDVSSWSQSWDQTTGVGKVYHDMLPDLTYGYPGWARFAGHAPLVSKATVTSEKISNLRSIERLKTLMPDRSEMHQKLGLAKQHMQTMLAKMELETSRSRTFHTYPLAPVLAQAASYLKNPGDGKKALDSLLHRVSLHEFGHNLGLRHNFYGSVDKAHWGHFGEGDEPVASGGQAKRVSNTSTVMDYIPLEDQIDVPYNWEPYDIAALSFAYSDGKANDTNKYLFCTDEHTILNALCNRHDRGTTPSEIALNMIKNYDETYWTRNERFDRAYWSTAEYEQTVAKIMLTMKKFLPMWVTTFDEISVREQLQKRGGLSNEEMNEVTDAISRDAKQAIRLSIAFYDAVIQQKASDRHYEDEVELFSGELKRIGILYDKIYAMLFLMGNDDIAYHPNKSLSYVSFMKEKKEPEFDELLEKVYMNNVTKRVDMEPWFINFARGLYSITSTDPYNRTDIRNVNRIQSQQYTREQMRDVFGIDVSGEAEILNRVVLDKSVNGIPAGTRIAYMGINGRYYVASEVNNPFSFSIIETGIQTQERDKVRSAATSQEDLIELFDLYLAARRDKR